MYFIDTIRHNISFASMFVLLVFCLASMLDARKPSRISTLLENTDSKSFLRIHHGQDVKIGEYPYVVILAAFYNTYISRLCTGSMLTEQWGLTAAHCSFLYFKKKNMNVWYANYTLTPLYSRLYTKILKMVEHPSFRLLTDTEGKKDLMVNNDICLFLVKNISLKSFGTVSSVDYGALTGLPVRYVGGGMMSLEHPYLFTYNQMQYGEGAVITCHDRMRSISKYIICITPRCSNRLHRPWYGDSGGPLLYDGRIVGVCSFGIESKVMSLSSYAPVSPYLDWIYDVMHSKT